MDRKDTDNVFCRKLGFPAKQGTKHDHYEVSISSGVVPLPMKLTVSRGTGDLTKRNVSGLADNLGVTDRFLQEASDCHAGRDCLLICLAGNAICLGFRQKLLSAEDRLLHAEAAQRLFQSASLLLEDAELRTWNRGEMRAIKRMGIRIATENPRDTVYDIVERWRLKAGIQE